MPKKNSASNDQANQTNLPVAKPNIFEFAKTTIGKEMTKLNKLIVKLEKSVQNHSNELEEKKLTMEECKNELKKLEELLTQT
jgi:dsDNA-specific endonuclease/ATPase MutS2